MRWLWLIVLLVSCAHVEPPAVTIPDLPLLPAPPVEETVVAPAPELPAEDRERLLRSDPWPTEPPLPTVARANKRATLTPATVGFERGGMLVYPYRPYAIYHALVAFTGSLHIQLQTGEQIRLVNVPKEGWIVQQDDAETVLEASHLVVTPKEVDAKGHLTLITSQAGTSRVYYLDLHTHASQGVYGVSWRHPPKGTP